MGIKTEITKLHYNKEAKGILFSLLKFASLFYGVGSGLKNKLYEKNVLKPKKVDAFVISIGNLTTGGVGKTPVVAEIAKYFVEKGEKVAIVSRGYGGSLLNKNINIISDGIETFYDAREAGDEPNWLSNNVSGVYVITSKNRYMASKYAVEELGVSKIILDDGFQHRKLHRDLDIVLIDSEKGFGNENLLPAGPLREGLEAFERIDKLVIVSKSTDHKRAEKYAKIMGKKLKKQAIVCYTEPTDIYNIKNTDEKLQNGSKVLAFSAIGQPQQFYNFLSGYEVAKAVDFDDHHKYTQADVDNLVNTAQQLGADSLVTTEKDAVKLKDLNSDKKIYALKLTSRLDVGALFDEN